MTPKGRYVNASFLLAGSGVLLIGIMFRVLEYSILLNTFAAISAPTLALLASLIGIGLFGRGGFLREDPFQVMNLTLSLGLIPFSVADMATVLVSQIPQAEQLSFGIGLIQLLGLLLWVIGTVGYLKASNQVMGYASARATLGGLTIPSVLCAFLALLSSTEQSSQRNPFESATKVSIWFALTLVVLSMASLLWIFRTGRLSLPLGLGFLGVFLMLIRSLAPVLLWDSTEPLLQILAVEAYLFLGAALVAAWRLSKEDAAGLR